MPKGGSSRYRSEGNSRAGLRDCPPALRRTLDDLIAHPEKLSALPPNERDRREQQIAVYRAMRSKRSAATKAGHVVRREREAQRLVDIITDGTEEEIEGRFARLTARQQELVNAWLDWRMQRKEAGNDG